MSSHSDKPTDVTRDPDTEQHRPLTPKLQAKIKEIEGIARIACVDFWNVPQSKDDDDIRDVVLDLAKDRIIRAEIVYDYVLTDQLLCELIARLFFDPHQTTMELWRNPKYVDFSHHIIENMSLLRKLALVKEHNKIPKPVEQIITRTNTLRNAVAHSLFPEDKRDFKKTRTYI